MQGSANGAPGCGGRPFVTKLVACPLGVNDVWVRCAWKFIAVSSAAVPVSGTACASADNITLLKSSRVTVEFDTPLSTTCRGRPPSSSVSSGGVGGRWPATPGTKNGYPGLVSTLASC